MGLKDSNDLLTVKFVAFKVSYNYPFKHNNGRASPSRTGSLRSKGYIFP